MARAVLNRFQGDSLAHSTFRSDYRRLCATMPLTSIHHFLQEILELFPIHANRATLPALRLVSKKMNELAGAKLFETLCVDLRRSANPQIVHQLENAASGKTMRN